MSPARRGARGALLALVCVTALQARAAPVDWTGSRFVYATNGASVADALNVFATGQHLPLRIDGHVEGVVSGRFAMPPQRFLDLLGRSYGFVWYYDGAVLQVSLASEQRHIAIRPHFVSADALRASLERAGLADTHFPLGLDPVAHTVDVHGPATYVARIQAAAERFEHDARKRVRTAVRVFRLTAANAADETRTIDGRTVVVPGAATLLRRRFEPPAERNASLQAGAPTAQSTDAPKIVEFDAPLPAIEADAATNSILIRDKAERIEADGALVADLDVRPQLVSVQTWVVDVDADAFDTLAPVLPPSTTVRSGDEAQLGSGERTATVGIAPDGGRALVGQLQRLAKHRQARIVVSQTALTHDRAPAIVDRHEARLVQREDDAPDDASLDLWLSVEPNVEGAASMQRIGLRVELGRRGDDDDVRRKRSIDESVAPGQCLVIEGPPRRSGDAADSNDGNDAGNFSVRRRLVLLIPRVVA